MGKILGDDDLNNLPTKIHYSYFDKKIGDCAKVHFYNNTEPRLSVYEGLQEVSDKIMKALCYVFNESNTDNFNINICNYFYYWLSDMLVTHLENKSIYVQILAMLYDVLYNEKKVRKCNPIDYAINENDIKNIKTVFDYSQDYNTYMTQLTKDNLPCNENYQNYLQNYVNIYKELQRECEGKINSNKNCIYFKRYFPNNGPSRLSTWTCELKNNEEQTGHMKEGRFGDEGKAQLQPAYMAISGSEGQPIPSDSHSGGRSTEVAITPVSSNGSSTPITSKSITAIASTTGFLVPSFLMYKFTPAGTWISKLLGRTPNVNHIPLRDSGIMEQFPDSGRFNAENDRFNISYSP